MRGAGALNAIYTGNERCTDLTHDNATVVLASVIHAAGKRPRVGRLRTCGVVTIRHAT